MPRRSPSDEDYDYDDDDYEDTKRGPRRFKKDDPAERKHQRDREEQFDRDHDYDERR